MKKSQKSAFIQVLVMKSSPAGSGEEPIASLKWGADDVELTGRNGSSLEVAELNQQAGILPMEAWAMEMCFLGKAWELYPAVVTEYQQRWPDLMTWEQVIAKMKEREDDSLPQSESNKD